MTELNRYLAKFFRAVHAFASCSGWAFILGSACLAASRVCQTLSFFLPLKIFIVISSGKVPGYFDLFPGNLDYNDKLVVLGGAVPVTYLLYIGLGVLHRWLIDRHHKVFVGRSMVLDGKEVPARNISKLHAHTAKALSESLFFLMSLVLALALSPVIAVTIVVLVYANLMLFYHNALRVKESERLTFLGLHRRQFVEYVSSSNYLLVFVVLVIEAVVGGPHIYATIFLLLLSRMVFQALNRFSVESIHLLVLMP